MLCAKTIQSKRTSKQLRCILQRPLFGRSVSWESEGFACLQVLPHNGEQSTVTAYACCMIFFGLLKSWAAPACNNPIFAEVVPAHLRTLVYSFDRCSSLS